MAKGERGDAMDRVMNRLCSVYGCQHPMMPMERTLAGRLTFSCADRAETKQYCRRAVKPPPQSRRAGEQARLVTFD
jgi:hypothetical protein